MYINMLLSISICFLSLYRIFDIVQYSVDAAYVAGALFEGRLGLDAG